jgi:hypothetical protein
MGADSDQIIIADARRGGIKRKGELRLQVVDDVKNVGGRLSGAPKTLTDLDPRSMAMRGRGAGIWRLQHANRG